MSLGRPTRAETPAPAAGSACRTRRCTVSVDARAGGERESTGTVFRIERLAVHDGPGIRTVLFFKGCPLRCVWCSSPESQQAAPEVAYWRERCTGCGDCVRACPEGAALLTQAGRVITDPDRCTGRGACVAACGYGARRWIGHRLGLEEAIRKIERDECFYHRSDGGVTLSGGEPTLQPAFARGVLRAARMRGVSTALETCGHFAWETCRDLGAGLDRVYVDIKHMDPGRHRALTGVDNRTILDNLHRMHEDWTGSELVIRVPLVPGINDDAANLEATAGLARALRRLLRVELLPYHRYGRATYDRLGRAYAVKDLRPPSEERLAAAASVFASRGVPVRIGG